MVAPTSENGAVSPLFINFRTESKRHARDLIACAYNDRHESIKEAVKALLSRLSDLDIRLLDNIALTRIIHEASTLEADPGMSTALRSVGLLDVLWSTPAGPSVARRLAKRCIHARLRLLATNLHE
jgi:hypothetical protein